MLPQRARLDGPHVLPEEQVCVLAFVLPAKPLSIHGKQCKHMPTVSARVPDELEEELESYLEDQKLDKSVAVRKLLAEGLERWERERALRYFSQGRVSFAKAAEMADMDVWDFAAYLEEQQVEWVDEEGALEDLEAA